MSQSQFDMESQFITSDYYSESMTPSDYQSEITIPSSPCLSTSKSMQQLMYCEWDHGYALLSSTHKTCSSSSSPSPSQARSHCNRDLTKLTPRRLFSGEDNSNCTTSSCISSSSSTKQQTTPLSERQQIALAMRLSSESSDSPIPLTISQHKRETKEKKNKKSSTQDKIRRNHKGETELHIAVIRGDLNRVKDILKKHPHHIDTTDFAGWSALHESCNFGHYSIAKQLIRAGADVNARGDNGVTPLIDAVYNRHHNIVSLLLRHGADPYLKNNSGKSAIDVAEGQLVRDSLEKFLGIKIENKNHLMASMSSSQTNNTTSSNTPSSQTGKKYHHHHSSKGNGSVKDKGGKRSHCSSSCESENDDSSSQTQENIINKDKDTSWRTQTQSSASSVNTSSVTTPSTVTNSSNSNCETTTSTASGSSASPKVPPIRIVIPGSGSGFNAMNNSNNGSTSSTPLSSSLPCSSPNVSSMTTTVTPVSSTTSTTATKFPYIVSSTDDTACSENESNTPGSAASQRITRSSQRVAQMSQKQNSISNMEEDGSEIGEAVLGTQNPNLSSIANQNPIQNDSQQHQHKKRKIKSKEADNDNDSSSSSSVSIVVKDPFALPSPNCFQMFLNIRKQVDKKRKEMMFTVQPKAPQGFDDYLLNRCSYLLEGKQTTNGSTISNSRIPVMSKPPSVLAPGSEMYELFNEHERHRHKLRVQHLIEREKLVLSVEQEILRVHSRAARAMANQSVPFSACTILKDEEIYNVFETENSDSSETCSPSKNQLHQLQDTVNVTPTRGDKSSGISSGLSGRTRYNGRLFLSWLQDVDDKWGKIKVAMLLRHRKEAESLLAMQKLEWEWKLKELGQCDVKWNANSHTIDMFVPPVNVNDQFDLLPA